METIKITLDIDGSEVTREFSVESVDLKNWSEVIVDMAETIKDGKEVKF